MFYIEIDESLFLKQIVAGNIVRFGDDSSSDRWLIKDRSIVVFLHDTRKKTISGCTLESVDNSHFMVTNYCKGQYIKMGSLSGDVDYMIRTSLGSADYRYINARNEQDGAYSSYYCGDGIICYNAKPLKDLPDNFMNNYTIVYLGNEGRVCLLADQSKICGNFRFFLINKGKLWGSYYS